MSEILRHPTPDDGADVWQLVRDTGVLDVNSLYAYAMWFRHFAGTCVVAEDGGEIVGFVTGYRLPEQPEAIFIWQVGVRSNHRGRGLASRLLRWVVHSQPDAHMLHTTITPSNTASRRLFRSLARHLDTDCQVGPGLSASQLGGTHESEELFRIGPFHQENP